jgi:hypothetical protein
MVGLGKSVEVGACGGYLDLDRNTSLSCGRSAVAGCSMASQLSGKSREWVISQIFESRLFKISSR